MFGFRAWLAALALCGALAAAQGAALAQAGKRVALVIGNGSYEHANALQNPRNDAIAVAKALTDIGFEVVQGVDLDHRAMEERLRDFLHRSEGAQVALLFYAGHGLQVDGHNYLVPVDATLQSASDLNFSAVALDRVLASMDDPRRANIIILDACRDNPLARSFAAKSRSSAVGSGLAAFTALGTGTLIAFSTAPDKVAADGAGANSPFTENLVKHLRTPGLEVRQMLTRVRQEVVRETDNKQIPWDNSSLLGEVYLAGRAPAASPPAAATPDSAKSDELAALQERIKALEQKLKDEGQNKIAIVAPPKPVTPPSTVKPAVGVFPDSAITLTRTLNIKMQTASSANDPLANDAANDLVAEVSRLSGGKITIEMLPAGTVVRAFQVLDAAAQGVLDAGFSFPTYNYGKSKAFGVLDGGVPLGLPPEKLVQWYQGEGQTIADEIYGKFKAKMLPCGVLGSQGGGWYSRPLTGAASYKGIKIRAVGMQAEFFQAAGAVVVQLPGGEIAPALSRGIIDAAEFAGPLSDHAFGFQDLGLKYYYFPSWHHPAEIQDFIVGLTYWNNLRSGERQVLEQACRSVVSRSLERIPVKEKEGLDLLRRAGIKVREFPPSLVAYVKQMSVGVFAKLSRDPEFKWVYDSYDRFR